MAVNETTSVHLGNMTDETEDLVKTLNYWIHFNLFPPIHLSLCTFIFISNMLVIIAFVRFHKLRTLTNYFVVNLAASDLVFGVNMFFCRILVLSEGTFSPSVTFYTCLFKFYLATVSFICCMFNLFWVAVERYIKLFYPLRYEQILTPTRVCIMITCTWILVTGTHILAILFHRYSHEYVCNGVNVWPDEYSVGIYSGIYFPFVLSMIFIYGRIGLLTRSHRLKIQAMDMALGVQDAEKVR